jgi:hypoxanthine-DNA glycosylase
MIAHPIAPVYDEDARILILGSFPSVKSRQVGFYYGHPQNRFWRVLAALWEETVPASTEEKRSFLLRHHIALWDVIASCEITGSSDSSIRDVTPNDLSPILNSCPIETIYTNGATAGKLYRRYQEPILQRPAILLPSTSPANASWSLERLISAWSILR